MSKNNLHRVPRSLLVTTLTINRSTAQKAAETMYRAMVIRDKLSTRVSEIEQELARREGTSTTVH